MLVYVTSLYAIRDDYLPVLYTNFQRLLSQIQAPIVVFTDRHVPFECPTNCIIVQQTLESFQTYSHSLHAPARLPHARNAEKDTREFMALMNTKVEMVWRALPYFPDTAQLTHIAWIDAGILKITKDAARVKNAFAAHQRAPWPLRSVAVPGCWAAPCAPSSDSICWRFCGGFFVIPTSLLAPFYKAVTDMLEAWLRAGHLAWEVNVWAALEWKEAAWFTWWGADHNETMLEVPGFLGG